MWEFNREVATKEESCSVEGEKRSQVRRKWGRRLEVKSAGSIHARLQAGGVKQRVGAEAEGDAVH